MPIKLRIFIACGCFMLVAGCVVPQIHSVDPLYRMQVSDPKTGEIHRPKLRTTLLDSETKRAINDAQVVLILARGPAYLPDTSQGPPIRPEVVVDKFTRLDMLTFTDIELYVWPFFAVGSLYGGIDVFVYKDGYRPVPFKQSAPDKYPDTIEMVASGPDTSKEMMIRMALEGIQGDEWKDYARKVLERCLE